MPLLASAFNKPADVIEIADNGPFFEDDFQLPGKTRLIRARPGHRPIIKVELPSQQSLKEHEAKFLLGGGRLERLVLEGIDLVVDLRDLPLQQTTLFACQGADVTLRDCSLTIYNGGDRKVSIFRLLEGPRPNRITLERSTIRGPIRTLVDVASARAEVVIDRSLVVGDAGPLISLEASEKPARSIFLIRSLLATQGASDRLVDRQARPDRDPGLGLDDRPGRRGGGLGPDAHEDRLLRRGQRAGRVVGRGQHAGRLAPRC